MAKIETMTIPYTNADDNQIWLKGKTATAQTWAATISGIPKGAKIKSVVLSFANGHTYDKPGHTNVYWGASTSGERLWSTSGSGNGGTYTVDLTSRINGNGTVNLYFHKTANSGNTNSSVYFADVKITITYEKTGSLWNRAENGGLVTYALYHAENGSLTRYNAYHAENGTLVKY